MNENRGSSWEIFKSNFSLAPIELRLFFIFSFAVTLVALFIKIVASKEFYESIIPTTGWQIFMPYAVTFLATLYQIRRSHILGKRMRSRYFNILFLALYILLNTLEIVFLSDNDSNNPYLMVGPLRPYWSIVIPALWILVLFSPRIKKYYTEVLQIK